MYNDELYHHGIKGMHWGVRRFQNLDGTLTKLGKRVSQEIRSRNEFASAKNNWQAPTQPTDYHKRPDRYTFIRSEKPMAPVGMGWADSRHYKQYDAQYNARPFTTGDGTSRNKPYDPNSYAEAGKYANEYVKNSHTLNNSSSPYAKAATAIGATASVIRKGIGQEISDRRQFNQLKKNYQTPYGENDGMAGGYGSLYANRNKNQKQREILGAELAKARAGQQSQASRIDIETLGRMGHKPVSRPSFDDIMRQATQQHEFNKELDRRAEERSKQYNAERRASELNWAQETAKYAAQNKPTFFTDKNGVKKERLSADEEASIARGLSKNTADFKKRDAELRDRYENHDTVLGMDDSHHKVSDVMSYDDYLRSFHPDHSKTYREVQRAKFDDDRRTWNNNKPSAREQSRQEALRSVETVKNSHAATDALRQQEQARRESQQRIYQDTINKAFGSSSSQAAYNSAVSRASSLFSTGSNRTRMSRATYNRSVSQVTSAARSRVSSYATKARTSAGKAFTNYMTKMAEASKTIDSDLWSF